MREWPLSSEELIALRQSLSQKMSMAKVIGKFSKYMEEVGASSFTHKCICPNPDHKQGNERTPSFYFSEQDKTFVCWGCQIRGDVFDFLEIMLGRGADQLAQDYAQQQNLSLEDCFSSISSEPRFDIGDLSHRLGLSLRDHLLSFKDKGKYEEEKDWVDTMFRRIDDRFDCLESKDYQQAQHFFMQVQIELERRKL